MAHMSMLVVDLTFGEVYDEPQRAPPGLRAETEKDLNHRGHRGHREKSKENNCGDSLSVSSEFSVVKTPFVCRRRTLILMQR